MVIVARSSLSSLNAGLSGGVRRRGPVGSANGFRARGLVVRPFRYPRQSHNSELQTARFRCAIRQVLTFSLLPVKWWLRQQARFNRSSGNLILSRAARN